MSEILNDADDRNSPLESWRRQHLIFGPVDFEWTPLAVIEWRMVQL